MSLNKIIFCIALLAASLALSKGAALNSSKTILRINEEATHDLFDPKNPRLFHLGTIDGKSFFGNKLTTSSSWENAKSYCTSAGMKIAKIATATQQDFLKSKYDEANFYGCFWTAGRDARSANQFVWDTDGTSLASGLKFGTFAPQFACLHYVSVPKSSFHGTIRSSDCNTLSCEGGDGVICET